MDIFIVFAVVNSPVVVLTNCNIGFSTSASYVVQPNRSTNVTVAVSDKLSAVSVYTITTAGSYIVPVVPWEAPAGRGPRSAAKFLTRCFDV